MITVSPSEQDIFTALRAFLLYALPAGTPVIQGQGNRTSEPKQGDFAVMWPIMSPRLSTNLDEYLDGVFEGTITGTTMDITSVTPGFSTQLGVGSTIFGAGISAGTQIKALGTGTGGIGTYILTQGGTFGPGVIAAGIETLEQDVEFVMQVDIHGEMATNNQAIVSTLFRDEVGYDLFRSTGSDVSPLFIEEPRQMPFMNAEQQYEDRYVLTMHLQANLVIKVPLQFAAQLVVDPVSVNASYPVS